MAAIIMLGLKLQACQRIDADPQRRGETTCRPETPFRARRASAAAGAAPLSAWTVRVPNSRIAARLRAANIGYWLQPCISLALQHLRIAMCFVVEREVFASRSLQRQ